MFIQISLCLNFDEYHLNQTLSKQFHIIDLIKNIVCALFLLTIKILYCFCCWFGNIFNGGKQLSGYIPFNSTIVFQ